MPMMHVGKMNVSVHDGFVQVCVCVRLGAIPLKIVCVLVVRVMPVSVTVDTIANDVIQAVRVMIVTSLSYVGRRWPCPRTIPGSGRIRQRPTLVQEHSK